MSAIPWSDAPGRSGTSLWRASTREGLQTRTGVLTPVGVLARLDGLARMGRLARTALLVAGVAGRAAAQDTVVVDSIACQGQVIGAIEVASRPPALIANSSLGAVRTVLHVLFQSTTTRADVVRPFLLIDEGDRCDPERLAEAARVLRTLPFIASATVRVVPDAAGAVRVEIETLDEVPLVIGGRWSGGVSGVTFGNENVLGQGVRAVGEWREGNAFRDGFGLSLQKYGALGRPLVLALDAARLPLGNTFDASVGQPFLSNLQHLGWHAGLRRHELYQPFVRAEARPLSLKYERTQWMAGAVTRLGGRNYGIFAGPVALYDRYRPAADAVIVTDSGFRPPDSGELAGRYGSVTTFRAGVVAGLRALTWSTVRGLGSLDGEHDVARGVQVALAAARGLSALGGDGRSDWGSVDLYAGFGGGSVFAAVRGEIEGERPQAGGAWEAIVAGGRVAGFFKPSPRRAWELSTEYSGTWRSVLPTQLSLGHRGGGPRGFASSDLPAARRLVVRLEERQIMGTLRENALWGMAFYADGARAWAGGVPFARDLSLQASVGIALLAAVPPASRRLIRIDLAVPVTSRARDSWRVQVSARDLLRVFWREPGDMARARAVALPASVFGWP